MNHEKTHDAARGRCRKTGFLLLIVALLAAACSPGRKIAETREEYSVAGIRFDLLTLPAMEFPGGEMNIRLYTEPRLPYLRTEKPFSLAETNTSYALWSAVYDWATQNGYQLNRSGLMGTEKDGAGMTVEHPVTMVDWTSAVLWCNALTEYHNREHGTTYRPVYRLRNSIARSATTREEADAITTDAYANGFRLPTALEWELASRYTTESNDGKNTEYPRFSGVYWIPFRTVSGIAEPIPGKIGAEYGRITSVPVQEDSKNILGFYGFYASTDSNASRGRLWQWCNDYYGESNIDTYHAKRGGTRYPRCSPHYNWPKTKWGPTCAGYNQITFRVARTINQQN